MVACHAAPAPVTQVAHKDFSPKLADVARKTKGKGARSEPTFKKKTITLPTHNFYFKKTNFIVALPPLTPPQRVP
jgi:hypothetical protein